MACQGIYGVTRLQLIRGHGSKGLLLTLLCISHLYVDLFVLIDTIITILLIMKDSQETRPGARYRPITWFGDNGVYLFGGLGADGSIASFYKNYFVPFLIYYCSSLW